jgi:uncharacterized iron-regulated protein
MSLAYFRRVTWCLAVLAVTACGNGSAVQTAPRPGGQPTPLGTSRVVNTATGLTVPFTSAVAAASGADIVFFGEEHDDPETHFVELALLEAVGRARSNVVLSLEMFERDVQPALDDYLAGRISEKDFLARSRPWDNFADYRPLVQLARARGWPVVAANIPRAIAADVSHDGLSVIDRLPPENRPFVAGRIACTHDAYYDRFAEEMNGHGAGSGPPGATVSMQAMTDRFFDAQCVKDETMAESIVAALQRAGHGAILVHVTGSFHTDQGLGTVDRVARRLPNATRLLLTAIPVPNPATAVDSLKGRPRADFLIFTRAPTSK